jgi:hypothetical protein
MGGKKANKVTTMDKDDLNRKKYAQGRWVKKGR